MMYHRTDSSFGRVYAIINKNNEVHSISFYDNNNRRYKQIDLKGATHSIDGVKMLPHTHYGYNHDEGGTKVLSAEEKLLVDKVLKVWHNKKQID